METLPGIPDWNNQQLELGRPAVMDTPTLIEWIQRQIETPQETLQRRQEMHLVHAEWHRTGSGRFGIYACCINTGCGTKDLDSEKTRLMALIQMPNEIRSANENLSESA